MNDPQDALPSFPTRNPHAGRSARWTAGFIAALGFAFMASSLIDAYEPADRAVSTRPMAAAPLASLDAVEFAGPADTAEVDQAVRDWTWETRGAEVKPSVPYDLRELWLER
jgi:hypothetical protein